MVQSIYLRVGGRGKEPQREIERERLKVYTLPFAIPLSGQIPVGALEIEKMIPFLHDSFHSHFTNLNIVILCKGILFFFYKTRLQNSNTLFDIQWRK